MASRSQKRDEGKGAFLARARAERLAREEERRRTMHAETIERWWRGRSSAAAFRAHLRSIWDLQMANLQQVLDTFESNGVPFAPPLASILIFVRQLLAFHRIGCSGDAPRVAKLAALVLASCGRTDPSVSYLSLATAAVRRNSPLSVCLTPVLGVGNVLLTEHHPRPPTASRCRMAPKRGLGSTQLRG
jgi:hypothetical protein